jgi:hypothetical protein
MPLEHDELVNQIGATMRREECGVSAHRLAHEYHGTVWRVLFDNSNHVARESIA